MNRTVDQLNPGQLCLLLHSLVVRVDLVLRPLVTHNKGLHLQIYVDNKCGLVGGSGIYGGRQESLLLPLEFAKLVEVLLALAGQLCQPRPRKLALQVILVLVLQHVDLLHSSLLLPVSGLI